MSMYFHGMTDDDLLAYGYSMPEVERLRQIVNAFQQDKDRKTKEENDARQEDYNRRAEEYNRNVKAFRERFDRLSLHQRKVFSEAKQIISPYALGYWEQKESAMGLAERSPEFAPYTPRAKWWQFWKA